MKFYCTKCGHKFNKPEIGGYDVPNGPGATMVFEEFCPICTWTGFLPCGLTIKLYSNTRLNSVLLNDK